MLRMDGRWVDIKPIPASAKQPTTKHIDRPKKKSRELHQIKAPPTDEFTRHTQTAMSADAMDVDPVSSPEKKRKNKEKDIHSSKKRKHHDGDAEVAESPSKKKERKNKEKHRKHKHGKDTDTGTATEATPTSSQVQDERPSSTSRPKKKQSKHHRHRHSKSPSPAVEDEAGETTSTRKPLGKPTGSQLASLSAESNASSSPFHLVTTSLHLPLSPVSISATHALLSLLSEHVSPLLLTYYPPVRGIILAYSNPSLSSTSVPQRSNTPANPQPLTPAIAASEYGVLYVYLNVTFLVFRPERTQTFEGWINVQSESFLGAVVFNLFSVGIERRRLPADWKWIAPGQEHDQQHQGSDDDNSSVDSDKEDFRPLPPSASSSGPLLQPDTGATAVDENDEFSTGVFQTSSGKRVRGTVRFRIRDVDVIPGSERDKGFISLEGTMLSPEEEEKLVAEERRKTERLSGDGKTNGEVRMAGALSNAPTPDAGAEAVGEKRKKKKSKTNTT